MNHRVKIRVCLTLLLLPIILVYMNCSAENKTVPEKLIQVDHLSGEEQEILLKLARSTAETYLKENKIPEISITNSKS